MSALPRRLFTPEEYNLLEAQAPYKSQYVAGEIFSMAGAQPVHIEIVDNLTGIFRNLFRGRPCRSYSSDMRVRAKLGDLWTYPDISVICGEPKFETKQRPFSLLNPQVLFEVLSPSTATFDRGDKFSRYRTLESLTDYVLVSTGRMRVEHFSRQPDGNWKFSEYRQPDEILALRSVACDLPLAEIYDRVVFSDESDDT